MQQPASGVSFTVGRASELAQIPERTLKRKCAEGGISAELVKGNGGTQYRIPLEALPEPAQIRYWVGQLKAIPQTDRRAYMETQPIPDALVRKVAQAAAVPRTRDDAAPAPWTHEEFEEKTAWFFTMPKNAQAEAFRRAELLWAIELVRELVGQYVAGGYDCVAMREIVSFVLSALVERELTARLTKVDLVSIGEVVFTLAQARARIEELRALPVF